MSNKLGGISVIVCMIVCETIGMSAILICYPTKGDEIDLENYENLEEAIQSANEQVAYTEVYMDMWKFLGVTIKEELEN